MISEAGDFNEFAPAIEDVPLQVVIMRVCQEEHIADSKARRARSREYRDRLNAYASLLRDLLFVLEHNARPRQCQQFETLRPVVQRLVSRGELHGNVLALFDRKA